MKQSTWNVDPTHSSIDFTVRHMVFAKVRGRFSSWSGTLQLGDGDLTRSQITASIDAASIDTGTADRDQHLRSGDFLDVETFPTLTFVSTEIEKVGGERYRVHGELTIRGVTRPVILDSELAGRFDDPWGNERIAFSATTAIDRTDFGLEWNQVLEAGGVVVGTKLEIAIELQAVKAG